MVKLCDECGSILTPSTRSGELVFYCRCKKIFASTPEDSLRDEVYLETGESLLKYNTFIENSSFDPTGTKVAKTCLQCGLNFMTLIYVGPSMMALYTCTCGARLTNESFKVKDVAVTKK